MIGAVPGTAVPVGGGLDAIFRVALVMECTCDRACTVPSYDHAGFIDVRRNGAKPPPAKAPGAFSNVTTPPMMTNPADPFGPAAFVTPYPTMSP